MKPLELQEDIASPGLRLKVGNVSHSFSLGGEELPVLDDISLEIEPSEFIALLGPSGCGKSTLLRVVAGLERPSNGTILEDGVPVKGPSPERIVVFQDPTLYPWRTVWHNVSLGLEISKQLDANGKGRVERILRRVGLEQFSKAYPRQLSGGMAQRAALARALINNPRLLVLDEPLGKLDSLTRIRMQKELVGLWRERQFTTLMVTHDVEEALLMADRVVLLSGRPARIIETLNVNLPYPRRRNDPRLIELRTRALDILGTEARPENMDDIQYII